MMRDAMRRDAVLAARAKLGEALANHERGGDMRLRHAVEIVLEQVYDDGYAEGAAAGLCQGHADAIELLRDGFGMGGD